ncbi:response regulator transcription factor [Paenibacillus humicola]|uniref:response regulator transcription factor n=1 Tax=Paenibacillus humicola TaxID=3110540 RepID=UPI00237B9E1D|nr:helix-turn-helix domain-containing protein [Paenibacillus humicola]
MYKVLLADDDYPVIEYLKQEIPWEALRLTVAGEAEDGVEALAKAREVMPDLLITDIGMPGMNGIELIQSVKRLNAGIRTVILSCHNDFGYAQQAVKLNVQDYVLKESMESEEIAGILEKLVAQIEEDRRAEARSRDLAQFVRQNRSVLKEKMVATLAGSPILDEADWLGTFKAHQVDFARSAYLPVFGYMNGRAGQLRRFQSQEILMYAVSSCMDEILAESGSGAVCFPASQDGFLFLFPVNGSCGGTADLARMQAETIQSAVRRSLKIGVSFIVSDSGCRDVKALKAELGGLMAVAEKRFYLPDGIVTDKRRADLPYAAEDIFAHYSRMADEFGALLAEERTGRVEETVSRWARFFEKNRFQPQEVKSFIWKLVMDQHIRLRSAYHMDFAFSTESLQQEMLAAESVYELERWLCRVWRSLIGTLSAMTGGSRRSEIVFVQKYVQKHLDRKMSLEEAADALYMNPSYFSRLFKKETGESFIGYVTRVKMEKAKEWLESSDLTVEEIAYRLGYDNKSYFNKCFKTVFGVSPSRLH